MVVVTTGKAGGPIFKGLGATSDKAPQTLPLGSQALRIREEKRRRLGPTPATAKGARIQARGGRCAVARMPKNARMLPE